MTSHPVPPREGALRAWAVAIVAASGVTRLLVLAPGIAGFDADEAVTAVMAQRILDGQHFVYYAGQRYLGTLEQYLQAAVFAVLPDTPFVSRLPNVALAMAICWLVYRLSRRVVPASWTALLAPALFAVGPLWNLLLTAKNRGAYDMGLLLGATGLLLALQASRSRRPRLLAFAFAACCGLGFWNNWMAAYLLIPAALWWIAAPGTRVRSVLLPAVAGFVLGALPALVDAVQHGLPTAGGTPLPSTLSDRAVRVVGQAVPIFLGLRVRSALLLLPRVVDAALNASAAAALLVTLWVRRRGLIDVVTLRTRYRRPLDVVLLGLVVGLALTIISPTSWYADDPRYLSPLFVLLPLAVAAAVAALPWARVRRAAAVALVCVTVAASAAGVATVQRYGGEGGIVADTRIHPHDVERVADALVAAGAREVHADYWLAMPLQFAGQGELVVAPYGSDRFGVRPQVQAAPSVAWVVPAGPPADDLEAWIASRNARFQRTDVAPWAVFTGITPALHP